MVLLFLVGTTVSAVSTWWIVKFIRKRKARVSKSYSTRQLQFQASIMGLNQMAFGKDQQALANVYETFASRFLEQGLNTDAIEKMEPWFDGIGTQKIRPLKYMEHIKPLPFPSCRLLVVPLEDNPTIIDKANGIIQQIKQLLPEKTDVYINKEENLHITLFHTSHPSDVRADVSDPSGGVNLELANHKRGQPTAVQLRQEREGIQEVVEVCDPPILEIDRVAITDSGVLIICWLDRSSSVRKIRQTCKNNFPGAAKKQSSIIHTSLLRILSAKQLSEECRKNVDKCCKQWNRENRGLTLVAHKLWLVHERSFSTIEGDKFVFPFTEYRNI